MQLRKRPGAGGSVAVGIDHDRIEPRRDRRRGPGVAVVAPGRRRSAAGRIGAIKRHAMEPCQQLGFVAPRILGR